jgi:endonuclease-3
VRRSEGRWQRHDDLKAKIKRIALLLEKEYGAPKRGRQADPLDTLIQTVLSQNTNDLNRDRAYERLKNRFPRWEDVLRARKEAILSAIRPGGLAGQKAGRIQGILRWIQKREGRLTLSFLKEMESEEIKKLIGGLN